MKTKTRNSVSRWRRSAAGFLIPLVLTCLAFMPRAQAAELDILPNGNTAYGSGVLVNLTSGVWNSGFGFQALNHDTAGNINTATGVRALFSNTGGSNNTATGVYALYSNTTGWYNSATGAYALYGNTDGNYNMANGYQALQSNLIGDGNTANGAAALVSNTSGSNNTALGLLAGNNVTTAGNVICIGANVVGANVSNSCFIGQIFGATSSGGTAVFVNSDGKLGTATSSRRFKEEIKPMERASETLFALKPVTFRYKKGIDPARTPQFGLVAEEVQKVNPDLVVRDKEGKPFSVRYDQVNAMLLNEFLKEHRKVERQEATIADLKKDFRTTVARQQKEFESKIARQQEQIEALSAGLQKVSTQIELSKFATGRIRRGGPAPQWRKTISKKEN